MSYYLLFIEDGADDRAVLVPRLQREFPGFEILEADTVEKATELLRVSVEANNPPSAVLVDGSMTNAGTLDTLDFIAEATSIYGGPLIATSRDVNYRKQMLAVGCTAAVSKYDLTGFIPTIRAELQRLNLL